MSRILVFRIGSIGDFVVALPCLHLVRKKYRNDEIVLLTNAPAAEYNVPAADILHGSGLVDRIIEYPAAIRKLKNLISLERSIRSCTPELLVYLAPQRRLISNLRDYAFFRWACGIPRIVGLPLNPNTMQARPPRRGERLWEHEAERLGRQIVSLGKIDFQLAENWDLKLSAAELDEAQLLGRVLTSNEAAMHRVLGISIGTKQKINDWGDQNWAQVLRALGQGKAGLLVLLGAAQDRERSQKLAGIWPGSAVNLCGEINPRISAAVLRLVDVFLCHDSGPMHLAAAVGTPCVAVFSRHNPPGRWFPYGPDHTVLYPCSENGTIQSIAPQDVIAAAARALDRAPMKAARVSNNA